MRTTIKKVVALAAGATMIGSTFVGAMAVDLASWPSPFVTKDANGKPSFDAMLVVGDIAATADVIGITDIAVSLQFQMTEEQAVAGTGTSIGLTGDSKKIETSSDKLLFGELVNSITSSVTKSDLDMLEDHEFSNEYGTSTVTQTIDLPASATLSYVAAESDDTDTLKPYVVFADGSAAYTFKLAFSPSIESDIHTSDYLDDVRNKKIAFLGEEYTILRADHEAGTTLITLDLMGGAVTDVLDEGETMSYVLDGETYEVTASYIGSSEVKLKVNGELTDSLLETNTFKLSNGVEVGIIDILAQNLAGEVDRVEFSLGANKLQLEDSDMTSATNGGTVTIGTKDMGDLTVEISATEGSSKVKIASIEFTYTPSEDIYLGVGDKASTLMDASNGQSGTFLLSAFDYKFEGLQTSATEEIKLIGADDYNYKLEFTNKAGTVYSTNVVGYNATAPVVNATAFGLGNHKSSGVVEKIVLDETEAIADDNYFCVNKGDYTRILQFNRIDKGTANDGEGTVQIKDMGKTNGVQITHPVSYANVSSSLIGSLNLDGNTFKLNLSNDDTGATLRVDMNGDADYLDVNTYCELWTEDNARIRLYPGSATEHPSMQIRAEENENNQYNELTVNFTSNANGVDLADNPLGNVTLAPSKESSDMYTGYTDYGMFVTMDRKNSDSDSRNEFTLVYPDEQTTGAFFVVGSETSATTTGSSGGVSQVIHKINVGATKLASQISDVTAQNLIVVGGPCANAVAAELLDNPVPCGRDFEDGKAMIKLYSHTGGKSAMLVAGYEARDTTRATKVVAENSGASLKALDAGVMEVSVNTINEQPRIEIASN